MVWYPCHCKRNPVLIVMSFSRVSRYQKTQILFWNTQLLLYWNRKWKQGADICITDTLNYGMSLPVTLQCSRCWLINTAISSQEISLFRLPCALRKTNFMIFPAHLSFCYYHFTSFSESLLPPHHSLRSLQYHTALPKWRYYISLMHCSWHNRSNIYKHQDRIQLLYRPSICCVPD